MLEEAAPSIGCTLRYGSARESRCAVEISPKFCKAAIDKDAWHSSGDALSPLTLSSPQQSYPHSNLGNWATVIVSCTPDYCSLSISERPKPERYHLDSKCKARDQSSRKSPEQLGEALYLAHVCTSADSSITRDPDTMVSSTTEYSSTAS